MNLDAHNANSTPAFARIEKVLRRHGVRDLKTEMKQRPRPKIAIDAIIRDVQAANAKADQ